MSSILDWFDNSSPDSGTSAERAAGAINAGSSSFLDRLGQDLGNAGSNLADSLSGTSRPSVTAPTLQPAMSAARNMLKNPIFWLVGVVVIFLASRLLRRR